MVLWRGEGIGFSSDVFFFVLNFSFLLLICSEYCRFCFPLFLSCHFFSLFFSFLFQFSHRSRMNKKSGKGINWSLSLLKRKGKEKKNSQPNTFTYPTLSPTPQSNPLPGLPPQILLHLILPHRHLHRLPPRPRTPLPRRQRRLSLHRRIPDRPRRLPLWRPPHIHRRRFRRSAFGSIDDDEIVGDAAGFSIQGFGVEFWML